MKQSRFWLVSTFLWLFFLYNVERLGEPINIASFVYIYTILCAVLVVLIPSVHTRPFYLSTLVAMPAYFGLKVLLNYEILGQNLPITVTEIAFIGITIFLTSKIGRDLDALNQIISDLTIAPLHKGTHSFESGQAQIYREIRRARHYHRPAALLSISVSDESIDSSLDRFVQEAQEKIAREYISARLADFLTQALQDTDVITKRNEHFITLLPEAGRENIAEVVRRLQLEAKDKLGLNLRIGSSTFPDEAVTFERMLERAEAEMYHQEDYREGRMESTSAKKERILQI
jgi:predicted signal transduction protein with EAL and GGDEF domain